MPTDTTTPGQSQTQSQSQAVTVTVQSSSDPEFEARIFAKVHSAGRQLGVLSAVVEVLLAQEEPPPGREWTPEARDAIEAFRRVQADIAREKQVRDPERLIRQLEATRAEDPRAFAALRDRLVTWLETTR